MQPRLIIYKRIEELENQINKLRAKMFIEHTNDAKDIYKEKIKDLEAALDLNKAIFYQTGKTQ